MVDVVLLVPKLEIKNQYAGSGNLIGLQFSDSGNVVANYGKQLKKEEAIST